MQNDENNKGLRKVYRCLCKWWQSLRGRIAALSIFYFLLLLLSVFLHYWNVNKIVNKFLFLAKCDEYVNNILEVRRYEKNFLLYGEKDSYTHAVLYLQISESFLESNESLIVDVLGVDVYFHLKRKLKQYKNVFTNLYRQDYPKNKKGILEKELRNLGRDIVNTSINLDLRIKLSIQNALLRWKHLSVLFATIVVFGLMILLFLVFHYVIVPLHFIQHSTKQIAEGNFNLFPKPKHSLEEISSLVDGLNKMMQELELRREQLIQAKKMASLGTFTAGIAHEINNPLNNIYLSAEMFLEEYGERLTPDQREYIEDILQQAQRASNIVGNLLDFSRAKRYKIGEVNIADVINNVVKVAKNQIRISHIDLKMDLPENLPRIKADPNSLRQVFINLIENAIQAMPKGGVLEIRAKEEGNYLKIDVSDTGMGIPQENLHRIFEPFFTTKEKGTGLGLAVTYGIIKKHGGTIKVKSKPNKGTTFTILLPIERDVTESD